MALNKVSYTEIPLVQILDRDIPGHDTAWMEICNHHCTPSPKYGRYLLTQFWAGYCEWDADENLEAAKEDWGSDWDGQGTLFKVVSDYLKGEGYEGDYQDVLLYINW
ncbi:MAG: hypothetical protein ACRCTP_02425 [Aeromonas popoffii]|uniref:hypothetical protein n=1 Tax=Aeromonas popoffii TaxID=70856 RepID=UPI003F33E0DA